ncbi:peptidoglycan -binding protein, partial [Falsiroseomonas selenitidurans]
QTQARTATAQELAEVRALTAQEIERRRREAEALAAQLAQARSALETAQADLAAQTQARTATAQELAEVRALTAQEIERRRREAEALAAQLAQARSALETAQADLAAQTQARTATAQELAEVRALTAQEIERRRREAEALAAQLAQARSALETAQADLAAQTQARTATAQELAEVRALTAQEIERRRREAEALAAQLAQARSALETAQADLAAQTQARTATAQELAELRALTAQEIDRRRREAVALAAQLAQARSALETAQRDLAARTQAQAATAQELAEIRALTTQEIERRRQEAEGLARELAAARASLQAAQRDLAAAAGSAQGLARDLAAERAARAATAQELAEARATATRDLEQRRREAEALAADLAAARQSLAAARQEVEALRAEAARLDQTVTADRATIEARLSDILRLRQQIQGLEALRDQLERQAEQALARAGEESRARATAETARAEALALLQQMTGRATQAEQGRAAATQLATDAARRAAEEERRRAAAEAQAGEYGRLSESARVEVARLTRQLEALRSELSRVAAALDAAEDAGRDKDAQIVALGQRLNVALAARVEELQRYRSDFFGRLRQVLGDRPEVRIVGDRFVFQSEVLFPVGSAELSAPGQQQVRDLAQVLLDLAGQFPADLGWILRVDGHADRSPIRGGGRFATNWELSAARAIAVARLLIDAGLPSNRVAAVAFGDTQPLDDSDAPDALARNRRIELRLEPAPTGAAPARPRADPRQVLQQVLPALACARLAVPEGGAPRVTGLARRGTEAALRTALQARGVTVPIDLRGFQGPYCPVLDALRPLPADGGGLRLGLVGNGPLPGGAPLRLDLALPAWPAHLSVHYLSNAGEAVRLEQSGGHAAGTALRLGEPRAGFPGWLVDEPFGTDMVLAIASDGPLLAAQRPVVEPVADFAAALAAAVEAARREGRRVSVQLLPVETVAR